jgi:hypothetical protein
MGKTAKKRPKQNKQPVVSKKPEKDPSLVDNIAANPVWQIGLIDLQGPCGWMKIRHKEFFDTILPKIQNFESMTWQEILGRKSHEIRVDQISKSAQKRLTELQLDDIEILVSLRLTGKQRIWGIKIQKIFKILWWDPEHEIYPSKLKHT